MRRPSFLTIVLLGLGIAAGGYAMSPSATDAVADGAPSVSAHGAVVTAHAAHAHAGGDRLDGSSAGTPDYSVYDLPGDWRDQSGETVRFGDLAGKVRVVALVYTSCQATCPLIVGHLKRVEASLPVDRRGEVGFVLVSLDPERDSTGRLAAWAAQTGLDPERWTLLNGGDDTVRELAATLDVRYQAQPDGELAHTNAVTVLDRAGAIVHQQTSLDDGTGETTAAVARLLRQRRRTPADAAPSASRRTPYQDTLTEPRTTE